MDVHALADAPVQEVTAAAGRWTQVSDDLGETGGDLRKTAELEEWSGSASDAMRHRLDTVANRVIAVSVATHWTGVALRHHASVLAQAKKQAASVLGLTRLSRMRVAADGTVTPSIPVPASTALAAAWSVVLHACRVFATAMDTATAAVISSVTAVDSAPVVTPVSRASVDAGGASAELVADPAATAAVVTMPAGLREPLDPDREQALREAVVSARTELALRGLDPDAVGVSVQELDGEAVVVVGDLRTAEKVTTIVSGVGSSSDGALVGSAGGAGRIGGPGHAVVAWHGYAAPSSLVHGVNPAFAAAGAPALRQVQSTLREWASDGAELQIVTHSYGTTLVGAAARDASDPLTADTVHLLGSPGTGLHHADGMQVEALDGHAEVHAWRAPGDVIGATTGTFGGVHGVDPTTRLFGADSVDGAPVDRQGGVVGRILGRMTDGYLWFQGEWNSHSSYLSDDRFLEQVR